MSDVGIQFEDIATQAVDPVIYLGFGVHDLATRDLYAALCRLLPLQQDHFILQ